MESSLDKIIEGYKSTWYGRFDWWLVGKRMDVTDVYCALRYIVFDTGLNSIERKEQLIFVFKIIFNRWD